MTEIGQPFNPWGVFTEIALLPLALMRDPNLSPGAKLCYARLLRYSGENGDCFPGSIALGEQLGVSPRQARYYRDELCAARLIRKASIPGKTNRLEFLWSAILEPSYPGKELPQYPGNILPPTLAKDCHTPWQDPATGSGNILPPNKTINRTPTKTLTKRAPRNGTVAVKERLAEVRNRIIERHPPVRNCGPAEVDRQLRGILKRGDKGAILATLHQIDVNHEAWCKTAQWTKDGGEFSKGLFNWLAPTMKRYLETPPAANRPVEIQEWIDPYEGAVKQ